MTVERATKGPYVPLEGMLKHMASQREFKQEKSAGRPHVWYVLLEARISWTPIVGMPPSKERMGSLQWKNSGMPKYRL